MLAIAPGVKVYQLEVIEQGAAFLGGAGGQFLTGNVGDQRCLVAVRQLVHVPPDCVTLHVVAGCDLVEAHARSACHLDRDPFWVAADLISRLAGLGHRVPAFGENGPDGGSRVAFTT